MGLLALTLIAIALQQPATPPAAPPATPPRPQPAAPATRRPAAPPPVTARATVEILVVTEGGQPIPDVLLTAQGPLYRAGRTDAQGKVSLGGLTPGTYRFKAEGEGLIALEKEVAVKPGAPISLDFALAAAPPPPAPPPPPPPPPPAAEPLTGPVGNPVTLSLPDLAEKSLGGREPIRTVAVGCSGLSRSDLLVVRESTGSTSRADVDQSFYLIAGEATLTLAGKEQTMTPGWFGLVPRGTSYTLARRGRNPAVVLTTVTGVPCPAK